MFSSNSEDYGYKPSEYLNIEPNPHNFKILKGWDFENACVILLNYPNCTNFEGNKVIVFKNKTIEDIKMMKALDPHFSSKDKSIIARFRPDKENIKLALLLASNI